MKKIISLLLIAAMLLTCFAACGEKPGTGGDDEGTSGGNSGTGAKVGDVLDAPEKTVSLDDIQDLTITTTISLPSSGMEQKSINAVCNMNGCVRFYEKIIVNNTDYFEQICTVDGSDVLAYASNSGGEFYETEFDEVYGSIDGYFRYNLATLGVDYGDWMETAGFEKREDEICQGKACYVYQVSLTNKTYPEAGETQAAIWVDKETGIWMKFESTYAEAGETVATVVDSVEYTSAVIPGLQPVSIKEQVIYDDNGIVITAKSLDCSNPSSAVLLLETKNNSGSDVKISSHYFDVNGLCLGGSVLSYSCAKGETKETELKLSNSSLDISDIEIVKDIELALRIDNIHTVTDGEGSYTVEDGALVEKTEPLTIETDCPSDYVQPVNKDGEVLIDADGVYLVLCSFEIEDDGNALFKAYCENKLSETIRTTIDIKTINGVTYDDFDKVAMQENSEGFAGFWIYRDTLQQLGIERIESIEFTYEVFSGESFVNSECVIEESETITLAFN